MADPPRDSGERLGRETTGRTPRWVWVAGIIGGVVIVALVIMLLLPGGHGPGQHAPDQEHGQEIDPEELPPGIDHEDLEGLDPDKLAELFAEHHG